MNSVLSNDSASLKILMESLAKLSLANAELTAHNEQLRAANTNLTASNTKLTAANTKLTADLQKLKVDKQNCITLKKNQLGSWDMRDSNGHCLAYDPEPKDSPVDCKWQIWDWKKMQFVSKG